MKIIETVKEVKVKTYVSKDGTEFSTKEDCEKYEHMLKRNQRKDFLLKEASNFYIEKAEGDTPFDGCENYVFHSWHWYKVSDQSQVDVLNKLYSLSIKVSQFPEFICVEEGGYDNECNGAYLSNSIKYVEELCSKLGVEVEFKKPTGCADVKPIINSTNDNINYRCRYCGKSFTDPEIDLDRNSDNETCPFCGSYNIAYK